MAKVVTNFDRSLVFTSLLAQPEFGALSTKQSEPIITEATQAWQSSDETDLHAFVQRWWAEQAQTTKEQ